MVLGFLRAPIVGLAVLAIAVLHCEATRGADEVERWPHDAVCPFRTCALADMQMRLVHHVACLQTLHHHLFQHTYAL